MNAIGYSALIEKFELRVCRPHRVSLLSQKSQKSQQFMDDRSEFVYPANRFRIREESWYDQLHFAIKYEGVNPEVLRALFSKLPAKEIEDAIRPQPLSIFCRKIWFLYEFLMKRTLPLPDLKSGNYVSVLDPRVQIGLPEAVAKREKRYRIRNNLLGPAFFCPVVFRTQEIDSVSGGSLAANARKVFDSFTPELLYRAVQYLYVKETKSSFAIEHETPDQRRMDAFVSLLRGVRMQDDLTESSLARMQEQIVDARYAQKKWRTDQVYVGETLTPEDERVHYIAPQAKDLNVLMNDWLQCSRTLLRSTLDPVTVAAIVSFGFVFLHPFDDGNGRLHRFLMHYVLAKMNFTPEGVIFPVSAKLLKDARQYDQMLESFSLRLMSVIDYEMGQQGEIIVRGETVDAYRAIDFTFIVERFQQIIRETIETEWTTELQYLKRYDEIRSRMREVVDMPDKKANQFIKFVQQNSGHLSQRKRNLFAELTDEEVAQLESIISGQV